LTGTEIADDPAVVQRLEHLYEEVDQGNTPAAILLPWCPGRGMIRKLFATKRIYDIIIRAIDVRLKSGKPRDDTLQMLLDSGDDNMQVVGFMMGLIIAGARSTGTTGLQLVFEESFHRLTLHSASWLLTYIAAHPEWKAKAKAEIESLVFTHSLTPYKPGAPLSDLSAALAQIPLNAWEGSTPVLDALIHETTRLAQPHTAMRKNMGPDVHIDGKLVPSGHYVVYPFSDVHLNEELYPNPWKFDPNRPRPGARYSYVGWGGGMISLAPSLESPSHALAHRVGKTTCLGQRLAKVEMKLLSAVFLLGINFSVVDKGGKLLETLPRPNWNDILGCKPPKDSCFIQYEVNY
jgi:sterol 14-demethylase